MSKAFKPGDLALTLVYDVDCPAGSQVELVKVINVGDRISPTFLAPTAGWHVRFAQVQLVLAYGEHELMPLTGDGVPAETLDTAAPCELVSA